MKPKYEDWFECLLLVKPKLLLVLPPEEEFGGSDAVDLRSLEEYDFYLKEIFEAESRIVSVVPKYRRDRPHSPMRLRLYLTVSK